MSETVFLLFSGLEQLPSPPESSLSSPLFHGAFPDWPPVGSPPLPASLIFTACGHYTLIELQLCTWHGTKHLDY